MVKRRNILVTCALVFVMLPSFASAQRGSHDQMLELAGTHTIITQQLAKEALLVALGVEREQNLQRLQASRTRFDRVLRGLRDGDDLLGLPSTAEPELLAKLDQADEIWTEMDSEIRIGIASGEFTAEQVDRIAGLSVPLLETMDTATAAFAERRGGQHFSMLLVAIDLSDRQRTLVEQMTKEFLLVAYGRDVETNRARLQESASQFGNSLDGLTYGDLDQLLLPAPTDAIRDQLAVVRQIWRLELRPVIDAGIAGDPLDRQTIARVSQTSARLVEESRVVVGLYLQL